MEQNVSARSEIFTNKGVKTLKPFWFFAISTFKYVYLWKQCEYK